jgi:NAD(P)-dependent dehydrogenase (short-subunit alcohol dehydrogenase family)
MGKATAKYAVTEGAIPILVGRHSATLTTAIAELPDGGASARFFECDATDETSMARLFEEIGPVDHIVVATSSGTPHVRPPSATLPLVDLATAQEVYKRLWAAYNAIHFASRYLRSGGTVTLISGASGRRPQAGWGIYGALHGAIEALGRAAAIELAPIRVNVISPGCLGVRPIRQLTHHYGQFDDLAAAVIAVTSNRAITSALLDVDGGESLGDWNGDPNAD